MIGALDLKLDNHTGFLVLADDVWSATQKIQRNIGGLSETQQIMRGEKINRNCFDWQCGFSFCFFSDKQNEFEEKMGEIVCSIGSKSSVVSVVGEISKFGLIKW